MMNVLILPSFYTNPEWPVRGIFFKEQALSIQKIGVETCVAYVEPRGLRTLEWHKIPENHFQITFSEEDGLPTIRMRVWNPLMQTVPGALMWSFLTERLIDCYVKRFGMPDLIHAHNSLWAGYAASKVKKKYDIPYVVTEHSTGLAANAIPILAKSFVRKTFSGANAVVSVSQGLAKAMKLYCGGKNVIVVPNVVQTDYFSLSPDRSQPPPFIFLGIAHLVERKGFHVLIKAFAKRFKNNHNLRLEIGGDGPQRGELEVLCKTLGIEDNVRFLGALSREQVREAMWRAHVFVLPSFLETFGVVLIEAMSTGLPVIATRCGGPEYIVNPKVGALIDPGDEIGLRDAMQWILDKRRFLYKDIREHTISHYGELAVARSLENIYQEVLQSN